MVCPGEVTVTVHEPVETSTVARHAVRDLADRTREIVAGGMPASA
jgi:hypothetical protein